MGMILGKIDVEQYAFEKLGTVGGVAELRRYAPVVAVETPCDNTHGEASNGAFRRLAQYIGVFGVPANAARSQIAMTAPVVNAPRKIAMTAPVVSAAATMAFLLPASIRRVEDAPAPTDPLVSLRAVGSRTMAAITFSGSAGNDAVAQKAKALRQALVEAKLLTAEEAEATPFELARFNPPFTLPPLRTNEIMIPVDDAAASRVCES